MPTVQHLLNGNLEILREAADSAAGEAEPTRWVATHIILGSAMRLRAVGAPEAQRAAMYTKAIGAFTRALAASCGGSTQLSGSTSLACSLNGNGFGAPQTMHPGPDGVQLVVECLQREADTEGNELLSRAIRVFRDNCAKANRRSALSAWFIGKSNLGCALTLLGARTPGTPGLTILEEAVDVMHEALRAPSLEKLAAERANTQVNLAEALHALAERVLPGESLRYLEDASSWLAAALCYFAPPDYRWVLQLDRGTIS